MGAAEDEEEPLLVRMLEEYRAPLLAICLPISFLYGEPHSAAAAAAFAAAAAASTGTTASTASTTRAPPPPTSHLSPPRPATQACS